MLSHLRDMSLLQKAVQRAACEGRTIRLSGGSLNVGTVSAGSSKMTGNTSFRTRIEPWGFVLFLSLLYAISMVDRLIIALLVDPVRADLGVSDTQIGLLFGLGFAVLYMLAGIPVAHLVDRGNRRRILISGVLLWSVATFVSGMAGSYPELLITRAGVAIGEAVLTPVAISMIADLFPKQKRSAPTSVYTVSGAVMGSGAFVVGAGAVLLAGVIATHVDIAIWRLTLMIVAVPGVLIVGLFALLFSEPPRGRFDNDAKLKATFAQFIHYTRANAGLYLTCFTGAGCVLAIAMGIVAWFPTYLIRSFGISAAQAGSMFGAAAVCGSIAGGLTVPKVVRVLGAGRDEVGVVRAAIGYAVLAAATLVVTVRSVHLGVVLAGSAVTMLALSATIVLPSLLIQLATPPGMRARMVAFFLSLNGVLSQGMGPLIVSALAEQVFEGNDALAKALSVTSLCAVALALFCYLVALRYLRCTPRVAEAERSDVAR